MYAKSFRSLLLLAFVALLASACTNYKEPAQTAISQAETALDAISVDAQKYLPDKYQEVQAAIDAAKAVFSKGDYKNALAAAKELPTQVSALATDVAAAKQAAIASLTESWNSHERRSAQHGQCHPEPRRHAFEEQEAAEEP